MPGRLFLNQTTRDCAALFEAPVPDFDMPARYNETWLNGSVQAASALMVPLPEGSLLVEPAPGVDWSGP